MFVIQVWLDKWSEPHTIYPNEHDTYNDAVRMACVEGLKADYEYVSDCTPLHPITPHSKRRYWRVIEK